MRKRETQKGSKKREDGTKTRVYCRTSIGFFTLLGYKRVKKNLFPGKWSLRTGVAQYGCGPSPRSRLQTIDCPLRNEERVKLAFDYVSESESETETDVHVSLTQPLRLRDCLRHCGDVLLGSYIVVSLFSSAFYPEKGTTTDLFF